MWEGRGARMNDEDKKREPIKAPEPRPKREGVRALVEAAASFEPVTAALTRIYHTTHPPKSEHERQIWQGAITERTNEHTERLDTYETLIQPKETLIGATAALAQRFIQGCPDGMGQTFYDLDELCALLPDSDRADVEDAAHELELFGLLSMRHHLQGWHARLSPEAYEQLDPQIMGWDPVKDAVVIAKHMAEHKTGHAPKLHELTGWQRRRFNPAFRVVLRLFPEGRIRRVIQADYPSLGVSMAPEDRVQLRRLINPV